MPPHVSLPHRLSLPLSLSVVAHGLLLGLVCWWQHSQPAAGIGGTHHPDWSISLVCLDAPRPEKKFVPVNVERAPADLHEAKLTKMPPTPPSTKNGPIIGTQQGAAKPIVGAAGNGASRGLLNPPATARRIVYLVDRSVSMGPSGALVTARQEVVASLRQLPPNALFQVIPYNRLADPLEIDGQRDLVPADPALIEQAVTLLGDVHAGGATDHTRALRAALGLRPDVIFLVTDADDLNPADVPALARLNQGRAILHVIELSRNPTGLVDGALAQLALSNHGTYRRVPPHP